MTILAVPPDPVEVPETRACVPAPPSQPSQPPSGQAARRSTRHNVVSIKESSELPPLHIAPAALADARSGSRDGTRNPHIFILIAHIVHTLPLPTNSTHRHRSPRSLLQRNPNP